MKNEKIRPLGNKVLVRVAKLEERTKAGIYIPDVAKEFRTEGEIIALGKGKNSDGSKYRFSVKVGDKIIYDKLSGSWVDLDGERYLILSEDEILAIY